MCVDCIDYPCAGTSTLTPPLTLSRPVIRKKRELLPQFATGSGRHSDRHHGSPHGLGTLARLSPSCQLRSGHKLILDVHWSTTFCLYGLIWGDSDLDRLISSFSIMFFRLPSIRYRYGQHLGGPLQTNQYIETGYRCVPNNSRVHPCQLWSSCILKSTRLRIASHTPVCFQLLLDETNFKCTQIISNSYKPSACPSKC